MTLPRATPRAAKITRRDAVKLAGALSLPLFSNVVSAQTDPDRPLRWLVGFAPGGSATVVTRIVANCLSARLGRPVVVENKPGASGGISVEALAAAPADGHTLVFLAASSLINSLLFDVVSYNLARDIAPVSGLVDFRLVMVVNPSLPVQTVAQFVRYAKANPGNINMASFGVGSTSHLAGELFKMMAGVDMVHVPYRGDAPAILDLIGGRVQVMFDVLTGCLPHVRSGALRALAMAGNSRFAGLPGVPTVGETVAGYEAYSWAGVGVRRGTPLEVIDRLNREINACLTDKAVVGAFDELAAVPMLFSTAEFSNYMASENKKWAKVIAAAGLKQR